MIRKPSLFYWACWLLLWPWPSTAQVLKYDLCFKRWGEFYLPWQDWRWWKAQGIAESGLNPAAVSLCGAIGIMQLMPATAKELKANPYDPESNIQGGIFYDKKLWLFWSSIPDTSERLRFTFAAYNAGPGNIDKARRLAGSSDWGRACASLPQVTGKRSPETIHYVERIHGIHAGLR